MSLAVRMLRRSATAVATAGLVFSVSTVVAPLSESARTAEVVATAGVNIRSGPGTKYSIVGSLARGRSIQAVGEDSHGWTPVSLNGQRRWIASRYLKPKTEYSASASPSASSAGAGTSSTTTALNARTGAGLGYRVAHVLPRGTKVSLTGRSSGEWRQISYRGKSLWVSSRYLTGASGSSAKPTTGSSGSSGSATTTEYLNARTGAGMKYRVAAVLPKGAKVSLTGRTSGEWRQISHRGKTLWVSGRYLKGASASGGSSKPSTGSSAGTVKTTEYLNARTGAGTKYRVAAVLSKGATVSLTGRTSGEWREVRHGGRTLWVSSRYLTGAAGGSSGSTKPVSSTPPKASGTRYATVALNIRTASRGGRTVTVIPAGAAIDVTGVRKDGREQVIYRGAVRWVTSGYLAAKAPPAKDYSKGLAGLRPAAKAIVSESRSKFPTITTYYGVRPDPLPDHPSGRAVDIMIPGYRSSGGKSLGGAVAEWARANASRLNVEYIIWDQRIWSVARSREGWRYMASRGSDTANHKDHVHITVRY
ncbi:SH3 domain-containing protein [Enemella sp. A6]|uniref:SH3 domain-containing protein n=1 Tax=Enemella sp. A6 TaxID=3440152 RepID=UPI003EB7619A